MNAQEKGPVSLAGHPTPATSPSPEKSWASYAPSAPFFQALLLGGACSQIGILILVGGQIVLGGRL
jgi:hypothetical protein